MAYKIEFSKEAYDDFTKLDGSVKTRIQKYLDKLAERADPTSLGEPLEENLSAYWKYRVGDYRLIAELKDDVFIVLMLVVGHRRSVYKTAAVVGAKICAGARLLTRRGRRAILPVRRQRRKSAAKER